MMTFFKTLCTYIKRGIFSPMFLVSSLVCSALMVFFVYLDYKIDNLGVGLFYFLQGVDASGAMYLLMMIVAFPAVTLFYDDYASGFFKFAYSRFGSKRYVFTISFAAGIIAAAAMMFSYLIFSLFIMTKHPLVPNIGCDELQYITIGFPNSGLLLYGDGVLCYILFYLTRGAMAAFFAVVAVFQSMIITNKYLTIISPILTYMILFRLCDKVGFPSFLNPSVLFLNSYKLYLDFGGGIDTEMFLPTSAFYPLFYCFLLTIVLSLLEIRILRSKMERQF